MTDNLAPDMQPMNPSSGGSFGAHVWGFFAGIASSLAFVQIFGGGWFGLLLAYCCLLPLYVTGLGGGRGPIITATVFGVIGVWLQTLTTTGGVMAAVYALMLAVPAMVICRVALIPAPQNRDSFISSGAILFTFISLGSLLLLALGGLLSAQGINLSELAQSVAENYGKVVREMDPSLASENVDAAVATLSRSLASLTALSWLVIHLLNFLVAQWLVGETGVAKRPTPVFSTLDLPGYLAFIFIAATVASSLLQTNLGIVIGALSTLFAIGFVLVGLAIMHTWLVNFATQKGWGRGARTALLAFYYIVFLGLQLPLLLALLLGLSDPWLKWRRKFLPTPTIH